MRRRQLTWILPMALTLSCCAPVSAADKSAKHALRGAGLTTCKSFVAAYAKKGPRAHVYFGWIDGYISGLNEMSSGTYDRAPWQSTELLAEVVRRACTKAPGSYFFAELRAVVAAMADQTLAHAQEKKILEMGDDRALVHPAVDVVHRRPGNLDSPAPRLALRVETGKGRQQRWVDVDDRARKGAEEGGVQDAHEAGEEHQLDAVLLEHPDVRGLGLVVEARPIAARRHVHGRHAGAPGALERRRLGSVRQHHRHLRP